ncbi:MAG: cytochrome c3 family protein [Kiloniellaceae bacterium]
MTRTTGRPGWVLLGLAAGLALGATAGWSAYGDIVFEREGDGSATAGPAGVPPATFPHWVHRIRYRCYVCHPKIFEMKAGANEITMDRMRQGESCAVCHDGATAFGIEFQTCARCHVAQQE